MLHIFPPHDRLDTLGVVPVACQDDCDLLIATLAVAFTERVEGEEKSELPNF